MPRFDVQKFAQLAAEDKIVNLDVTLSQFVQSGAIGSIAAYDDPWEVFCGNDLRFFVWPGPRRLEGLLERGHLAQAVRESIS